jgi:bifunctional non-homologous end joining protein LigD
MGLQTYQKKRDFQRTSEPKGRNSKTNRQRFVVQEHHASNLHFDFRLEMGGVLKSWAVRKGPSLDPAVKRLAVTTEDHPIEYLHFQGTIPKGSYGAGEHRRWDIGTYQLLSGDDPLVALAEGKIKFRLTGDKLQGEFNLIRLGDKKDQWLLIKGKDEHARPGWQLELLIPDEDGNTVIANEKSQARTHGNESARKAKNKGKRIRSKVEKGEKMVTAQKMFSAGKLEGDVNVKIGKHVVSLSHLDKIYYPDDRVTKGDLLKYYYEVSKYILPYLRDRPLIMKRYPSGITEPSFHQHNADEVPEYVRAIRLDVVEGHTVNYVVCDNLPTLLYLSNIGAIERHPWHSRVKKIDRPDYFIFDLDPGEDTAFSDICKLAISAREVLERLGLACYAKTSGARGIHIYVPVKPVYHYEQVADFAEQVAALIARENPVAATVERALNKRQRRQIYVDHMQNARGKSVVAPYSVRPKSGATVSAPLEWDEVKRKKITPQHFTIRNILKRIEGKGDLFKEVLQNRQSLAEALERIQELQQEKKARRARA